MDTKTTFASRFSELCGDIAQAEIAQALGISRATVGYYKSGGRSPDVATLAKIARHFSVTSDYLIGLSDAKQPENQGIMEELGLSETAINVLRNLKAKTKYVYRIEKLGWVFDNDPREFVSNYLEFIGREDTNGNISIEETNGNN